MSGLKCCHTQSCPTLLIQVYSSTLWTIVRRCTLWTASVCCSTLWISLSSSRLINKRQTKAVKVRHFQNVDVTSCYWYPNRAVLRLVWPFDGIVGDGLPCCCSVRVIV